MNGQLHHHCTGGVTCPNYHCCECECEEAEQLPADPVEPAVECDLGGEACPLHHHCSAGRSCAEYHCCALCPESEFLDQAEKSAWPVHAWVLPVAGALTIYYLHDLLGGYEKARDRLRMKLKSKEKHSHSVTTAATPELGMPSRLVWPVRSTLTSFLFLPRSWAFT